MKLSNFEKFVIQMIKDTWRVLLIAIAALFLLLWSLFTMIEKYLPK